MNDIKKSIEVLKEQIIKNEKILDGLPEKARARATDLSNVVKACHVAISVLEKQMPKKIKKFTYPKNIVYMYCPECDEGIDENNLFCSRCGQKIDWEVENE
ncbi:MAG: zinc ribbon domain-containing protein [Clostridiaceae bacterium]|nr:zinc ribbon domain-containing protein [Clostridiaceae bacterium]